MKKLYSFILGLGLCMQLFAQDCQNPVSANVFQSNFNQVAVQQTNQKKLEKAEAFVNSNCLTSAQVKNLAQLFTEDSYRLDFCKTAYLHTFDRVNFYEVYDSFTAFSYAFRLNDYIHSLTPASTGNTSTNSSTSSSTSSSTTTSSTSNPYPVYPNLIYPSIAAYNGVKGCTGPVISDDAFKIIGQNVFSQPTDEAKTVAIQNASDANCLSFAMIMKLTSLLNSESMRLQMLKNTFSKVFDQENYNSGTQLFSESRNQAAWVTYAKNALTPPPPPCVTSDADFNTIKSNVHAKSFDDDKMKVLELAAKDRCFTVAQIKTLGKEFSFSDNKLKLFKMLYAKCNDQSNYYQLVDELTFSTEKTDLSNFIKNGGK